MTDANRLAAEALAAGRPTGWFESLYEAAADGEAVVPWDRDEAHPVLVEWFERRAPSGRTAIVVGCGFGADAEYVAARGFATTAFDLSPTAIRLARERHPDSPVDYTVGDLLDLPPEWIEAFDLVVEVITVQALPQELRAQSIANIARLVAPGGTLIVISGARDEGEEVDGPPWPLTRAEIEAFGRELETVAIERLGERGRAEFRRPR
jgi:SAM-dependent methyltransferase